MLLDEREAYAPLVLFEYDHKPGHFCLMLGDNHMVDVNEVFEANDQYGNGYGWEAVARQAVRARAPAIDGAFDYDPEAGMFVAYGEDVDALKTLGAILRDAFRDRALLAELIQGADPDWWD